MLNKLLITKSTSPEEITKYISILREQKGKEKEVLKVVNDALSFGHDFVANLFFEEALTNQHLYMNDNSNKKALIDMQNSVLRAGHYINKYNLTKWQSRYFRFLGRVEDYKKDFKKSSLYYKKAIKYVNLDPDVANKVLPRKLELEGFLAYSMIMSGNVNGFKLSRDLFNKFSNTKEGLELKNKDYTTWVIWFSAVVINTYNALYSKKIKFDTKLAQFWVNTVHGELSSKKDDYLYRKKELSNLMEKMKLN